VEKWKHYIRQPRSRIMNLQYRQGDVLLVKVDEIPRHAKRKKAKHRIVLAYGEQTGHAHSIAAELAELFEHLDQIYLDAKQGAQLTHEEHSAIKLEPGAYKVVQQRRYVEQPTYTAPDPNDPYWEYAMD
jgi:hypothetical protein